MIEDCGKHYLYRHIRLDTNQPFYIGIGTKNPQRSPYERGYSHKNRNFLWKRVVNKTAFRVEILLESNNYSFIKHKEIEFINLYGIKLHKKGILVNLTIKGTGVEQHTLETKNKISNTLKEQYKKGQKVYKYPKLNLKQKQKRIMLNQLNAITQRKKVNQYDLKNNFIREFKSLSEAAFFVGLKSPSDIARACENDKFSAKGFKWKFIENNGILNLNINYE